MVFITAEPYKNAGVHTVTVKKERLFLGEDEKHIKWIRTKVVKRNG